MSDSININIKSSGDNKYEISISPSSTVLELKNAIAEKADVEASRQRLIYSGKVLKDNEVISSYKIQSGHTVHLVKSAAAKPANSSATNSGDANTTNATTSTSASGTNSGVPSNISAGSGAFNPLADLTGARYAGYTQLPSASMFGPDGGMNNAAPDPEQLSQMMSNPMFQESMNSLLSNPQMLDYMIEQSPQLRAMGPQAREMLQSPFFRQMMSNPDMMRSMMLMGRNFGGAGGATSAFPAPGSNPTVAGDNDASTTNASDATSGATPNSNAPPNPFASMFPGGAGAQGGFPPIDPFALFGGQGAGGFGGQPPVETDNRPPEERYETQLSQLNEMGFFDFDRNVAALRRSGGNVQGAVEYLFSE